ARLDRHRELARVDEELVQKHRVNDVVADVLVRSVEDGQYVSPADDPDELPAGVDHREPLDPHEVHHPGGLLDRVVRGGGHRRARTATTPGTCRTRRTMSWPASLVSGRPASVTMPSITVTWMRAGSTMNSPRITSWLISWAIAESVRSKTERTSARLTMPTSR